MTHGKIAFKNIVTSLVLQLVTIICGFILPRIIVTTYGSDVNGLVSSITQFLSYITLLDGGIGLVIKAALYKPLVKDDKAKVESILRVSQKFLSKIVYVFLVYVMVLCVVYPMIVHFGQSQFETIALILAISLSTIAEYALGLIYKLYLQARQQSYVVSIIQMITLILSTVLSVILIKIGCSISTVKFVVAAVYFIRAFWLMAYVKRRMHIRLSDGRENFVLKGRWDGFVQHAAAVIHENTDVVILTVASSIAEVSVYAIYNMVLSGVRGLIQALSNGIDAVFGDLNARGRLEDMNDKLKKYELVYYAVIAILFGCELTLITPFVQVYMNGVIDADYYRPVFGFVIVAAQALWAIRQPYSSIALSAGRFKETKGGAILEACINIVLSISLVWKFGLVGVAIGTFAAMLVRTLDYVNYASKHVLKRRRKIAYKHILLFVVEVAIVYMIAEMFILKDVQFLSYLTWMQYALLTFILSTLVVITINCIAFRDDILLVARVLLHGMRKKK